MRRVRAGQYVVDPHAVAGAMLRRPGVREALLGARVGEAAGRERGSGGAEEPDRTRRGT